MPSKSCVSKLIPLVGLVLAGLQSPLLAAELSTLFTTPQERQIINSNRYRSEEPEPVDEGKPEVTIELPTQPLAQEEVVQEYKISGITVSQDGPHSVWINSVIYEDGEQLEDSSQVRVLVGDEIRVRITAPDGKHYYATSGETLEISYLVTVQN
ncbi:MAG: hypothetical protein JSU67_09250 [Gammaproteobacteria bacterium]|nr:MAG: hypothetical protein EP300_09035 [Gammaproteobacteria bacterium]UCH41828.1 MAG: hypothetical protein JSU67_09250 [Gammaproteobacteria bacterium]